MARDLGDVERVGREDMVGSPVPSREAAGFLNFRVNIVKVNRELVVYGLLKVS